MEQDRCALGVALHDPEAFGQADAAAKQGRHLPARHQGLFKGQR